MNASQRGRLGFHVRMARGTTNTEPARAAFRRKFELLVDPDGVLDPDELDKRVAHARSAHYARLAQARWGK